MEEEIDIYAFADLPTYNEKDWDKCKQCVILETQLNDLKNKYNDLEKCNKILEDNYSSILLTAKSEVSRKDRMINDLRQQLNDKIFRRGRYRPDAPVSRPTITNEDSKIPIPPPDTSNAVKNIVPQVETVDVTEYVCNFEPLIEEDDDVLQKYEPHKIFETLYSQRLRKKLQDEDDKKKIQDNQEIKNVIKIEEKTQPSLEESEKICKKLPDEDNKKKIQKNQEIENVKKIEERTQPPLQESEKILKPPVPDNERECNLKCNIDNKENVSSSNQLQRHSATLISQQSVTSSSNEDSSIKSKHSLSNRFSFKRTHEDKDETIPVKRTKIENHDHFREHWGPENEKETIAKQNQNYESCNYNSRVNTNLAKFDEIRDERHKKIQDSSHSSLASRLRHISEQSVSSFLQERRRDVEKRDRDNWERGKQEYDKYRNNYDSERYFDKYEKDRDLRGRLEHKRHERDYYRHDKFDKRRYDLTQHEKFDKDENTRHERDRNDKYNKRSRRSESLSPVRNYSKQKDSRNDNFNQRNQKGNRIEDTDWRYKLDRPNETDVKLIMNDFNSRRQSRYNNSNCSVRSKSCGSGREKKESELLNPERSRSRGKEIKITDPNKKITLENYRARKDQELHTSEKVQRKSADREQKIKENAAQSKKTSTDKDPKKKSITETKISSSDNAGKIIVKADLGKKNTKLSTISEESIICNKELEDGEIASPSKQSSKNENTSKLSTLLPGVANNYQKNITTDIISAKKGKIKNTQEKGNNIETNKIKNKSEITGNSKEKNDQQSNSVSDIQTFQVNDNNKNKSPADNTNSNPKMVEDIIDEILNNTFERQVQNLDSFIERAEKVLEENKEVYSAEQISREVVNELREEMKITLKSDTDKIKKSPKKLQKTSSPIKKKKKLKSSESMKLEAETKIASQVKEEKNCQQQKSKKIEEEKNNSTINANFVKINENPKLKISCPTEENKITREEGKIAKEENKVLEKGNKITEKEKNLTKENKITKEENKIAEQGNKITKEENKIIEKGNQITKEENKITREEGKIAKEENKVLEKGNKITEKGKNLTKENKITKEENKIAEQGNKITKEENKIIEKGNQITKEEIKITEKGKKLPKEESKVAEQGNKITKEENKIQEKGNKITENETTSLKNVLKSSEESCPSEVKKVSFSSIIKVLNLPISKNSEEVESNAAVPVNISSAVKERRKNIKEQQKSIETLQNIIEEVKLKEVKKQTPKVKQDVTDAKTKTKKSDDKLRKKKIVIIKRKRPVILTDTNASTTIVAKENLIINLKLNTSGEKNNLLS